MINKKWVLISFLSLSIIGLVTYSTIYYTHHPLPTDKKYSESLITQVFDNYFNDKKENIIDNEPKYWWDVVGSESNLMKNFYKDLNDIAKYKFTDVKITYNNEPEMEINKVKIDIKLNVNSLSKDWVYNGIINYIVKNK